MAALSLCVSSSNILRLGNTLELDRLNRLVCDKLETSYCSHIDGIARDKARNEIDFKPSESHNSMRV